MTAGVVGGQSLIESAKRQRILTEFNSYSTAFTAFKLEYDAKPGDMINGASYWPDCQTALVALTTACNGNGDGQYADVTGYTWAGGNPDPARFWAHLEYSQIIPNKRKGSGLWHYYYSGYGKESVWWVYTGAHNSTHASGPSTARQSLSTSTTYLTFAFHTSGISPNMGIISPKDARAIDQKSDDGLPMQGKVLSGTGQTAPSECISGTAYNLTNVASVCTLIFELEKI